MAANTPGTIVNEIVCAGKDTDQVTTVRIGHPFGIMEVDAELEELPEGGHTVKCGMIGRDRKADYGRLCLRERLKGGGVAMQYAEKITLCEVGPRDGLQNEAKLLTTEEKTELIEQMIGAGFKVIEVGSFVSPKAVPQMANTDEVFLALGQREGVQLRP